jgi:N-acetylmuramoyl-L-alanine amidase
MRVLAICIWLVYAAQGMAAGAPVEVRGVRLWAAPDHTRVVFDVTAPVEHSIFSLGNPDRLVIDLSSARPGSALAGTKGKGNLIKGVRSSVRNRHDLRIVLDLTRSVRPKSFPLPPNGQYGHRLVIDLYDSAAREKAEVRTAAPPAGSRGSRELVIAIDAGHGGEDSGARGRHGTREKDVVLAIARKLAALVEREPGMRPVLIRDGDYYVGLRQRINLARKRKADMFISIHADAFKDHRARGSSVFVLSQRGASSEMARWLAAKENSADLVGGVSLDDKDDLLAEVLLDLSQTATIEASMEVADNVLDQLRHLGNVHKATVQQAGFVVLKSPDIPSLLVETAFISNPAEERKLTDPHQQRALALAMLHGIKTYFSDNPPAGTQRVARQHVIRRGDTLSEIAARYRVKVNHLQRVNGLKSDRLRVGDVLQIPASRDG